jgi:filamentous hemagglutinin family protein
LLGLFAFLLDLIQCFAQQLPSGATFQAGNVKIEQHNSSLHIHQSTPRAVIDWQSFNVGKGAAVHFIQPSQAAATLNRVIGAGASQILGQITAPGQVFITNGNGVYFGKSASIDVGSMVASSFDIGTSDFMNGDLIFKSQNGREGSITNAGDLKAQENGFIALLAPEVRNEGIIFAKKGSVILASGEMIELQTDPANQLVGVRVNPGKWNALVENKKVIEADGGLVVLSAQAESSLFQGLVKNSGVVQAKGIKKDGGRIMLTAGVGGRVKQEGVLDASSEVGRGGLVTLEGEKIELAESSVIDGTGKQGGGNILVGGDWQGGANEELRVFDDPHAVLQAKSVIMEKGAVIDASAIKDGDGGKIVLWSDVLNPGSFTTVKGELYAKGGDLGGNGGMIETSGHILAINQAKISTIAPLGNTGMWLLDPGNINITDSAPDPIDDPTLPSFPVSSDTDIHPTSIANALESTGVSIQTGSGNYDITVSSPISYTGADGNSLTINAGDDISINDSINLGTGQLTLNAGDDLTVSGNITAGQLNLDADGGAITVDSALDTSSANGNVNLDADTAVSINAAINSGSGSLSINAGAALSIGSSITSGSIDFEASSGNITINNHINTSANDGAISLDATNGSVTLDSSGSINSGSGALTINASENLVLNSTVDSGTFSADVAEDITIDAAINTGSSSLTLEGRNLTVGNIGDISSGTFLATLDQDPDPAVGGNVVLRGPINSGSGTLTIRADDDVSIFGDADLTTTNTSADGIKIYAGYDNFASQADYNGEDNLDSDILDWGGDITIDGSPSISAGTGGRVTLFTGGISESSGLSTLVPTVNFRYNADRNTDFSSQDNFTDNSEGLDSVWEPLSSGIYGIYREQPSVRLSTTILNYGEVMKDNSGNYHTYDGSSYLAGRPEISLHSSSGLVNGDLLDGSNYLIENENDENSWTAHSSGEKFLDVKGQITLTPNALKSGTTHQLRTNLHKKGYYIKKRSDYSLSHNEGGAQDGLRVDPLTVNLVATAVYDGNDVLDSAYIDPGDPPDPLPDPPLSNEVVLSGFFERGTITETLQYSDASTSNYHVASQATRRYVDAISFRNASVGSVGKAGNYRKPHMNRRQNGVNEVTILVRPVELSINAGSTGLSKVYDGSDERSSSFQPQWTYGTVPDEESGLAEGDASAGISYANATYDSPNAGDRTFTITGLTINNLNETSDASDQSPRSFPTDYEIRIGGVASTTLVLDSVSINKATLDVTVNDSFKFATQSDPVGYSGLSFEGFVNNETPEVLTESFSIQRSDPTNNSAGNYALSLNQSGSSSINYNINPNAGVFTIVPVNQLLVAMGNADSSVMNFTYGSDDSVQYNVHSVTYLNSSNETVTINEGSGNLTFVQISDADNDVSVRDSSGNAVGFNIGTMSPQMSNSNKLKVGTYKLQAENVVGAGSSEFADTVKVVGSHLVEPLEVTPVVTNGKIKIYDGDPDLLNLSLDISGKIAGDLVNINGVGTYRNWSNDSLPDKDVRATSFNSDGSAETVLAKKYKVENITLSDGGSSGAGTNRSDHLNYVLSSNIINAEDGRIDPKQITYLSAQKSYDGTNQLRGYHGIDGVWVDAIDVWRPIEAHRSVRTADGLGLIYNEDFKYSSGTIKSKHVNGPDDDPDHFWIARGIR